MESNNFTENLFSYGTLRYENVQLTAFGRRLKEKEDSLPSDSQKEVHITDADAIATSGEAIHSILYFSGNSDGY